MKLLLDTHIWVWYLLADERLSTVLREKISDSATEIWISPISSWEVLLLAARNKLFLLPTPEVWVVKALKAINAHPAPLTHEISILSRSLEFKHNDPADRFIAATAAHYGLVLATADANLSGLSWLKTMS